MKKTIITGFKNGLICTTTYNPEDLSEKFEVKPYAIEEFEKMCNASSLSIGQEIVPGYILADDRGIYKKGFMAKEEGRQTYIDNCIALEKDFNEHIKSSDVINQIIYEYLFEEYLSYEDFDFLDFEFCGNKEVANLINSHSNAYGLEINGYEFFDFLNQFPDFFKKSFKDYCNFYAKNYGGIIADLALADIDTWKESCTQNALKSYGVNYEKQREEVTLKTQKVINFNSKVQNSELSVNGIVNFIKSEYTKRQADWCREIVSKLKGEKVKPSEKTGAAEKSV